MGHRSLSPSRNRFATALSISLIVISSIGSALRTTTALPSISSFG